MVASTQTLQVPYHAQIVDENGNITQPWVDFFSIVVNHISDNETSLASHGVTLASHGVTLASYGVTIASYGVDIGFLETAATNMTDIADQSVATATQIANYWQSLRSDLQNI